MRYTCRTNGLVGLLGPTGPARPRRIRFKSPFIFVCLSWNLGKLLTLLCMRQEGSGRIWLMSILLPNYKVYFDSRWDMKGLGSFYRQLSHCFILFFLCEPHDCGRPHLGGGGPLHLWRFSAAQIWKHLNYYSLVDCFYGIFLY